MFRDNPPSHMQACFGVLAALMCTRVPYSASMIIEYPGIVNIKGEI